MIPIKLALRNFMCYRDNVPPLYFDGIHVACLCGDNGSGKSALLDAMTWALWSQARAKSDDELIHIGQMEMEVEFEFSVGPGRYRVIRKRAKPGLKRAGRTLLELQLADAEGFRSITGNTVRETQRKIIELLRMDYQTFINSAFLLQGRADEFTIKLPSERKKVLADILGLSFYDELEGLAKEQARGKKDEIGKLESAITEIDHELGRKEEYQAAFQEVKETLSILDSQVARQEADVNTLRQSRKALEIKEEQLRDISRRLEQASKQLHDLDIQVREHRLRIEKYEKVLTSYQEELAQTRSRLGEVDRLEQGLVGKKERQQELSNTVHHLSSTNARLKEEMEELKAKIELLGRGEANCPLCGAELGVEGRDRIMASYQSQGQEKGDSYRANESGARQAEGELNILKREISELERKITSERTRWARHEEALEKDRSEAESLLPQEKAALSRAEEAAARWRATIEEDTRRRNVLSAELASLPQIQEKLRHAEEAYKGLLERQRNWRDKMVATQERLRRCTELEQVKEEKTRAWRQLSKEKSIYDELTLAFGKKGIQALLIEAALPEIEEEADRLLGRMTDNRMHVRIETQRAKKTKKEEIEETLDIKISDELGTRSYEMFSGGEAFRINFALRIALSKLLARRHGAPLLTLVIDEGFGTQDNAGREKLIEAINSIQDDFDKIIVVTHIEELREVFPVRIEVTKTAEGSMISVT